MRKFDTLLVPRSAIWPKWHANGPAAGAHVAEMRLAAADTDKALICWPPDKIGCWQMVPEHSARGHREHSQSQRYLSGNPFKGGPSPDHPVLRQQEQERGDLGSLHTTDPCKRIIPPTVAAPDSGIGKERGIS